MSLRSFINLGWQLLKEGLEPDAVKDMAEWLNTPPQTPEQQAERERLRKARENKTAVAGLHEAFRLAG